MYCTTTRLTWSRCCSCPRCFCLPPTPRLEGTSHEKESNGRPRAEHCSVRVLQLRGRSRIPVAVQYTPASSGPPAPLAFCIFWRGSASCRSLSQCQPSNRCGSYSCLGPNPVQCMRPSRPRPAAARRLVPTKPTGVAFRTRSSGVVTGGESSWSGAFVPLWNRLQRSRRDDFFGQRARGDRR